MLSSTSTKTSWITLPASDSEDADGDTKIQVEEGSDDDTIRFDTAGTERAVITSTGSVGIGTASPSSVLDVVASTIARNTGGLDVQHSNGTQGISFGYDGIRKIGELIQTFIWMLQEMETFIFIKMVQLVMWG